MKWMTRQWPRARRNFPRLRDIAVVLIGLVTAATTTYFRFDHSHLGAIVEGAWCVVAALALWWRRSHPMTVVLIALLSTFVTGVEYSVLVAVATLTVRRRDRYTLVVMVAAMVAMVVGPRFTLLHVQSKSENLVSGVINSVLAVGLLAALGAYVGVRRDLVTNLQERAERAEAEREIREEQGRLGERTRIAREMHDVLAHKVSLIALQAGGLEVTNNPSIEQVRASAALIRQTAHQALEDLRDVLGVLRDEHGDARTRFAPQPTLGDIAGLVESSRNAGLPITVVGTADLNLATGDLVGRAAFRLVQEALTNVHKHARRAATTLRLDGAPGGRLEIEVVNLAPVGASQLLPGSGLGLVGLRERVVLAGGEFVAGPTDEGGFRVFASLPWQLGDDQLLRPSPAPVLGEVPA